MRNIIRVVWAPISVVALHAILAGLIGHKQALDPVFHFLGGAAGAFAVLNAIRIFPDRTASLPGIQPAWMALAAVAAAALLWECGEFVADHLFGTRIQTDWMDTTLDLALGIGGAVLGVTTARCRRDTAPADRLQADADSAESPRIQLDN